MAKKPSKPRAAAAPSDEADVERDNARDLERKAKARAFLGKKGLSTVDRMAPLFGPGSSKRAAELAPPPSQPSDDPALQKISGLNAATLASADYARRKARQSLTGDDALRAFREEGAWSSEAVLTALGQAFVDARSLGRHLKAAPGLRSAAQAMLAVAVLGEVLGVRRLLEALARHSHLSQEAQRALEGASRRLGTRQLTLADLQALLPLILDRAGDPASPVAQQAAALLALGDSARALNETAAGVSARHLLELRPREACLIFTDMPVREPSLAGRRLEPTQVVALARLDRGDLALADPAGLYDPVKGAHDPTRHSFLLPQPLEVELKDFLHGQRRSSPQDPLARLLCNAYLSAAAPGDATQVRVPVVGGAAFKFC